MNRIIPHLWYDKEAREAVEFYISLFENSQILSAVTLHDTPSGDAETFRFQLAGEPFMAISAGPYFHLNPSLSLMVNCRSVEEVDRLWNSLMEGGSALMPLGEYPFNSRYGWVQDRYGLSWQLMLAESDSIGQKFMVSLLFAGEHCGKAVEAVDLYTSIFLDSSITHPAVPYEPGEAQVPEAKLKFIGFQLAGMDFAAMDHGFDSDFTFNEAFSLVIPCKDQAEIDFYWDQLSAVPEAEACGWVKDRFGLSWQIVPEALDQMMAEGSDDEIRQITEAFLKMKKFDLAALERAKQSI